MTTIAITKNEIACDLQFTHPSGYKFRGSTKIHQVYNPQVYPKPFYIGFSGAAQECQQVVSWLLSPDGKPPKVRASEFVVLTADKKMFTFKQPSNWIEINQPYYAVGSGSHYATGALASGKTAIEAVRIAAKHDPNTGHGTKNYTFAETKKPAQGGLNLAQE